MVKWTAVQKASKVATAMFMLAVKGAEEMKAVRPALATITAQAAAMAKAAMLGEAVMAAVAERADMVAMPG
jgi:hypothetical protein